MKSKHYREERLQANISFWGSLIIANVIEIGWIKIVFSVLSIFHGLLYIYLMVADDSLMEENKNES